MTHQPSSPFSTPSLFSSRTGFSAEGSAKVDYGVIPKITQAVAFATITVAQVPARVLLAFLWLYQRTLSPVLPVITGGSCGCRFFPSCSHYAVGAIREHGALMGTLLALRRLGKCTPLHPGGFDPVPPRRRPRCVATRIAPSSRRVNTWTEESVPHVENAP